MSGIKREYERREGVQDEAKALLRECGAIGVEGDDGSYDNLLDDAAVDAARRAAPRRANSSNGEFTSRELLDQIESVLADAAFLR